MCCRMVAKYRDPATQQPFYNKNAFRTIREAYYHYLDEKGNRNDPQVRILYIIFRVAGSNSISEKSVF